jgi:hypothetical protein
MANRPSLGVVPGGMFTLPAEVDAEEVRITNILRGRGESEAQISEAMHYYRMQREPMRDIIAPALLETRDLSYLSTFNQLIPIRRTDTNVSNFNTGIFRWQIADQVRVYKVALLGVSLVIPHPFATIAEGPDVIQYKVTGDFGVVFQYAGPPTPFTTQPFGPMSYLDIISMLVQQVNSYFGAGTVTASLDSTGTFARFAAGLADLTFDFTLGNNNALRRVMGLGFTVYHAHPGLCVSLGPLWPAAYYVGSTQLEPRLRLCDLGANISVIGQVPGGFPPLNNMQTRLIDINTKDAAAGVTQIMSGPWMLQWEAKTPMWLDVAGVDINAVTLSLFDDFGHRVPQVSGAFRVGVQVLKRI